ncbi:hypothetical protein Tco_0343528 [Tanacetum coccineum]
MSSSSSSDENNIITVPDEEFGSKNELANTFRMDNPNITMEEYIRLEEEKARRHGKVYNWETAKYGKIWYYEDIDDLRSIETEFQICLYDKVILVVLSFTYT